MPRSGEVCGQAVPEGCPSGRVSRPPHTSESGEWNLSVFQSDLPSTSEPLASAAMIRAVAEWTLAQVSRLLHEPQHRLIYLCEKGAVAPDLGDARGRGSSRGFSERNILEFALALRLRKLELPVTVVAAVVRVLRRFAEVVRNSEPSFDIVTSLRGPNAVDVRILVKDGEQLFFLLALRTEPARLFGPLDFRKFGARRPPPVPRRIPELSLRTAQNGLGGPEGSREARIEVSVTEIARGLRLVR